MNFGNQIINFYNTIRIPGNPPAGIDLLLPFQNSETRNINSVFYNKYYSDNHDRIFLIGINPGRFGAGITGIPFTDPVHLENSLKIPNTYQKKHEISSRFIYSVIDKMHGPDAFFHNFYFTAVSPVGFVSDGKNINYYDSKELITEKWEAFFVESLRAQIQAGSNSGPAYSLGTGKNLKYLRYLNNKYKFFRNISPLPHPRWIMQYRYKRKEKFARLYVSTLWKHILQ